MAFRTEVLAEGITCILGDCRDVLPTLGKVDAVVTSPPYWGAQRDYGHGEQLGHERSPEEFCAEMCRLFSGVREVLSERGTLWLNLGDSYAASGKGGGGKMMLDRGHAWGHRAHLKGWRSPPEGYKQKDLVGVPWMLAFAMRASGWTLRRDVVWNKASATEPTRPDRPAGSHEMLFLFSRGIHYNFDVSALPHGTVWMVRPQGYEGHPAAFPIDLINPCALASTNRGETILDPFMGSGTTGIAAVKLGRKFIGIEIEPKYFDIACRRISKVLDQPDLFIERPLPAKQESWLDMWPSV
jgi:site-specific DNA-methyltransferase (adenine-specific)